MCANIYIYIQSVANGEDVLVDVDDKIGAADEGDVDAHPSPWINNFISSRARSTPRSPLGIVERMVKAKAGDATQSSAAKLTISKRAASCEERKIGSKSQHLRPYCLPPLPFPPADFEMAWA